MRVLFLDIDGVLNCDTTKERIQVKHYYGLCGVDPILRDRFLNWLATREVSIVLSSMWRYHPEMMEVLNQNGIHFIDTTPKSSALTWQGSSSTRGDEIQEWLNSHQHVTDYAILDDNNWFSPRQLEQFVQTDPAVGLQDIDLVDLDDILFDDE